MSEQETDRDWSQAQDWKGMDGACAWHLIYRHAEGWGDTGAMMDAWLAANVAEAVKQERERCIAVVLAEKVDVDDIWNEGDEAYNLALRHAADALAADPPKEPQDSPKVPQPLQGCERPPTHREARLNAAFAKEKP